MQKLMSGLNLALSALVLSACTGDIVTTERWEPSATGPTEAVASYWLPTAKYPVTIKRKNCILAVAVGDASFFPDPRYHYLLKYNSNAFTSDDVTLGTDDAGLLQTVNASSEPQTSAIIGKVFEIAGDILKLSALVETPRALAATMPVCDAKTDVEFTYFLDPTSPADISVLQKQLGPQINVLIAEGAPLKGEQTTAPPGPGARECLAGAKSRSGVCYRALRPYSIHILLGQKIGTMDKKTKKLAITDDFAETTVASLVPDPDHTLYVPMDRDRFTKTDIKATFTHGVLSKYQRIQPSEALAVISIPADILKGLLGLPPLSSSAAGPTKK